MWIKKALANQSCGKERRFPNSTPDIKSRWLEFFKSKRDTSQQRHTRNVWLTNMYQGGHPISGTTTHNYVTSVEWNENRKSRKNESAECFVENYDDAGYHSQSSSAGSTRSRNLFNGLTALPPIAPKCNHLDCPKRLEPAYDRGRTFHIPTSAD